MANNIGTYSLSDLVAQNVTTSIMQYGLDGLLLAVQERMAFLNAQVSEQLSLFAEESTDSRRIWGSSENFSMSEVDEYGVAKAQKGTIGVEVAFPLRKFSIAVGSSKDWMYRKSAAEFAKRAMAIETAYVKRIQDELAYGIFNKTNYTFKDYLIDNTSLAVKAFINADSSVIPDAPNGATFTGSSHQHYVGTAGAALAYTDIDLLVANVSEHGNSGVKLFIPQALVATLEGLASTKFVKLSMMGIIGSTDVSQTVRQDNPDSDPMNKLVGYWNGIEVYTRSFMPTAMILCVATNSMGQKPLVYRVDPVAALRGLRIASEEVSHPLMATTWEAHMGFGAWNRSAIAVLDTAHQTTYTAPTLIR